MADVDILRQHSDLFTFLVILTFDSRLTGKQLVNNWRRFYLSGDVGNAALGSLLTFVYITYKLSQRVRLPLK